MPIDPSNTYGGRRVVAPKLAVAPKPPIRDKGERDDEDKRPYIGNVGQLFGAIGNAITTAFPVPQVTPRPMRATPMPVYDIRSSPWGRAAFPYPQVGMGDLRAVERAQAPSTPYNYYAPHEPTTPYMYNAPYNNPGNPYGIAGWPNTTQYLPIVEAPPIPTGGGGGGSWGGGGGGGGGSSRQAALNAGLVNWRI